MSDLKAYLASKYMSGPKADAILAHAGKKKRKRPKNEDYVADTSSAGGLVLQDEDELRKPRRKGVQLDGEDAPVIGKDLATFKKGQSAWATVGSTSLPVPVTVKEEPRDTSEDAESSVKKEPEDTAPKPQITKRKGGLRTAKELAEAAARAAAERSPSPEDEVADRTRTVHRDQAGRVLDVDELRAEAKRAEEEEARKELERQEWTKGFTQREDRERQARELASMTQQDVARYADDAAMNREMKGVERWNDPAANFTSSKKKKAPKRPVYKGSYAQNRFNIPPGFRWDGVDRSNGFEKKWLQAQNTMARKAQESNQMSLDDL